MACAGDAGNLGFEIKNSGVKSSSDLVPEFYYLRYFCRLTEVFFQYLLLLMTVSFPLPPFFFTSLENFDEETFLLLAPV